MIASSPRNIPSSITQWIVTVCSFWFIGGLFLDGWAHNHVPELETFFTPWHAVFYSGFFVLAGALLLATIRHRRKMSSWVLAIPSGYGPALAGCAVFLVGGVGDLIWHELLGVEADIEALLSPTHLMLATGMVLMLSAPYLSWSRLPAEERQKPLGQIPAILSLTFVTGLLSFMTQYSHFVDMLARGGAPENSRLVFYMYALPISGYILHTIFLCAGVFLLMKRARPVFGAVTLLLTVHVFAMGIMRDGLVLVPAALVAGVLSDLLLQAVQPIEKHRAGLHLFAFALPFVFFSLYTLTLFVTGGVWWSVHMWTGSAVIAGFAGLLLSFLVWPSHAED